MGKSTTSYRCRTFGFTFHRLWNLIWYYHSLSEVPNTTNIWRQCRTRETTIGKELFSSPSLKVIMGLPGHQHHLFIMVVLHFQGSFLQKKISLFLFTMKIGFNYQIKVIHPCLWRCLKPDHPYAWRGDAPITYE